MKTILGQITMKNGQVIPFELYPSLAPLASKWPKFIIGTLAPQLNISSNLSYMCNPDSNAPIITNSVLTWPGVNFVFSIKYCDIIHTKPQNTNANK